MVDAVENEGIEVSKKPTLSKREVIFGGCMVAGSIALGCIIGYKCHEKLITKGVEVIWNTDPTLRDHMWKAVEESFKEK